MGEVIYFVSDTHLGDGSGADRFRYPRQLLDLLQRIEAEPGAQLVLLGDFMELWAMSLESVLVQNAPLFSQIARLAATRPVIYVVGNHDCLPWYYFVNVGAGNIRIAERFTAAQGALVALHGHQFDPFNKIEISEGHVRVPWVRKIVQVMGFLGKVGGEATGDALADMASQIEKAANSLDDLLPQWDEATRSLAGRFLEQSRDVLSRESPGERGYPVGEQAYEEGARKLMRGGARFVVMGHTHHPLVQTYGGRQYVNTGSWVWDKYPPTYGRFADGKLDLMDGNRHEPYEGKGPPS